MHVGKLSKDSRHPDYAPSVFHHQKTKSSSSSSLAHFERATSWAKRQSTSDDASSKAKKGKSSDLCSDYEPTSKGTSSGAPSDVSSECEELKCRIHQLEKQIAWLEKRNEELQTENEQLKFQKVALEASLTNYCTELAKTNAEKSMLLQLRDTLESQVERERFGGESIRNDDAKTCFYTGLPTFTLFIILFNILKSCAQVVPESKGMNEFLLVKLQLNLPMKDLECRLHCSESNFSNIFEKWFYIMHIQPDVFSTPTQGSWGFSESRWEGLTLDFKMQFL